MPPPRKHLLSLKERRTYTDATLLSKINERFVCEPNSGCWLWTGRVNIQGYGLVYAGGRSQLIASRAMYELTHSVQLPTEIFVCHRCDTPPCVNPHHLFLGTAGDNVRDAARKGRTNRWGGRRAGEANHGAKLTAADVEEIRRLGTSVPSRALGRRYGVSKTQICCIRSGKAWSADWTKLRHKPKKAA